jgi:CRISPR-associated endonuclease/helicase Cas3
MYGLSEEGKCRFSIALGLRTLTLQTGDALSDDLKLKNEMAVLIGSQAVKDLHVQSKIPEISEEEQNGSESAESLLKDQMALIENLAEMQGDFSKWLEHDPKILKLIQAPVLVSTVDYLMPATEGIRGGRQIAPMLRLLTSDLVLDEPDDFGLADLPALCRLVNWAGMLGSRVLLSTATISPILASTLFTAYQEGRRHYTEVNGELGVSSKICCAWFDEFKKPQSEILDSVENYEEVHSGFVEKRIKNLDKEALPLRKSKLIPIQKDSEKIPSVSGQMASVIRISIEELHQNHSIQVDGKAVSIGLVRMANIDPLVHVAKKLLVEKASDDTLIHYCIYHSQFSLLQRSSIEKQLDNALTRKDEKEWLKNSGFSELIAKHKEKNHIFVVLATPVAEVGRDHDYDWAVVEPSSMRSIIQLAGRIQRHRKLIPPSENIHILSKNLKGLKGKEPCFVKPGFETKALRYNSCDLRELIAADELEEINAIPRIKTPIKWSTTTENPPRFKSFNGLEHLAQTIRLKGSPKDQDHASHWWQNQVTWCGELQSLQPFRKSQPSDDFRLVLTRTEKLRWQKKVEKTIPVKYEPTDDIEKNPEDIKLSNGNVFWSQFDLLKEVSNMAEITKESEEVILRRFTHLSLKKLDENTAVTWQDHSVLGVYQILKNDGYEND